MAIKNSAVYTEAAKSKLLKLDCLIFEKSYSKDMSTWEPGSAVLHFQKMINRFYKDHLKKLIATSLSLNSALPLDSALPLNSTPPIVKPLVKSTIN